MAKGALSGNEEQIDTDWEANRPLEAGRLKSPLLTYKEWAKVQQRSQMGWDSWESMTLEGKLGQLDSVGDVENIWIEAGALKSAVINIPGNNLG